MGRSTRVRAIGLVGAVMCGACATSDEGESSGPPPFTTNPGDGGAGDDDDGGTTGADDDGASSATAPAEDGGSNPTIAEDGPASDTGAGVDDGGFDTGLDDGGFDTGFDDGGFEESGGFGGECCEPSPMPGCADDMIAQCVCAEDPYCCEMEWNEDCIYLVDVLGCGVCFGGESGGFETGGTGGGGGDCCTPGPAPGCGDPMIEQCVCGDNMDVFCCEEQWDEQCVDEAAQLCGAC